MNTLQTVRLEPAVPGTEPREQVAAPTPVWRVGPDDPTSGAMARAARLLRDGGVILYPTETFYGLGGHPARTIAIRRIYRIKGRDFRKPLPLIAADAAVVRKVTGPWSEDAAKLAAAFWPGPLTLVFSVRELSGSGSRSFESKRLSPLVHGHTGKIAVRVSSHPVAKALASLAGGLLISTSANFSGDAPYTDPGAIPEELSGAVDGLLHGGILAGRMPSTIVDVSSDPPRLVRAGCLSPEEIQAVLNPV